MDTPIAVSTTEYLNRFRSGLLKYGRLSMACEVIFNPNQDYHLAAFWSRFNGSASVSFLTVLTLGIYVNTICVLFCWKSVTGFYSCIHILDRGDKQTKWISLNEIWSVGPIIIMTEYSFNMTCIISLFNDSISQREPNAAHLLFLRNYCMLCYLCRCQPRDGPRHCALWIQHSPALWTMTGNRHGWVSKLI